jgi:DNA polymerase III epsilon subunit-like protein
MKLARHIDDGTMINHQLQYLRYYYNLEIDLGGLAPHDALADIIVLEQVFKKLARAIQDKYNLSKAATIERMLDISMKPSLMKSIKFGKFSSKTPEEQLISNIAKTDPSYLIWLLNEKKKKPEGEEDWIYTLNYYLK